MVPTLETADGKPVDVTPAGDSVNREFAQAMADDTPDTQAPPNRRSRPVTAEPKRKPGRPPKEAKARTTAAPAGVLSDGQRAEGVKGLAQVGAGLVLMAGKATGNDAFKADAVTIASSADQLADACVQTAKADPKFAAALDKVCSAGPYAALITVMVGIGSQVARNHKPGLSIPGTVDPAELLKAQSGTETVDA